MSYDIYDLGLNAWLSKSELVPPYQDKSVSGLALASLGGGLSASLIEDGEVLNLATVAKKSFSDTTAGKIEGLDTDGVYKWLIGNATSSVDWAVTTAATLTVTGAIVSDSGVLGGWNILSGYIYNLQSGTPIAAPNDGVVLASGNEAIIIYEDTAKRIELGYLASGIYGLKGYDTGGSNVMFELSDTQMIIAGWTISQTTLANGTNIILDASNKAISINSATYGAEGVQIQYNAGDPRAYIGDGANQFVQFDGTNLSWKGTNTELTAAGAFTASSATITGSITATGGAIGGFTIGSDYITDLADSFGLSSNVTAGNDVRFWAGATFANRASAPFIVYENGYFVAEYGSLNAGLTLGNGSTKSGTITMSLADTYGDVYVAGGTFNATTWTATNGFILGIDDSDSNKEKFFIGGASSSLDWNVTALNTLTVIGTINATAGYLGASTAAIVESTGLNLGTTGHVRGGQTAYNSGTGFFLGYESGAYKLSLGDSTDGANKMTYDGAGNLTIIGKIYASQGVVNNGKVFTGAMNDGLLESTTVGSALTRDLFVTKLSSTSSPSKYSHLYSDDLIIEDWNSDFEVTWNIKITSGAANCFAFWGLKPKDADPQAPSLGDSAGFYLSSVDNKLYTWNGDGASNTSTDVSASVTLTNANVFRMVYLGGTSIKYYINDVLVATHTTNLPNSDTPTFAVYGSKTAAGDNLDICLANSYTILVL